MSIDRRDLSPGKVYRVEFSDCCLEGVIVDRFLRYTYFGPDSDYSGQKKAAVFERSRLLIHGDVVFTEATLEDHHET